QKEVVDFVKGSEAWKRSGGRDHVFVLTDPVAMWHVRAEIAPAIMLVVDFGGWYRLDSKTANGSSSVMVQHTQVSLLKDVIVPYSHLLPKLRISEDQKRHTLLYFKGAKHRHRFYTSLAHVFGMYSSFLLITRRLHDLPKTIPAPCKWHHQPVSDCTESTGLELQQLSCPLERYQSLIPIGKFVRARRDEKNRVIGGGLIREKLWDLLVNEPQVIIEEGFPNATGKEQSIKGMRSSEFCLHPAGDTPTSCRLFDAIQSLCIPVIVSDEIVLPFEGMVDYSDFSVFVALADALQPNWLVSHLKSYSVQQKDSLRQNMARIQHIFEYDNGYPGGIGPVPVDGAVNQIWKKVHQKMPMIKEAIVRERRKPPDVSVPLRCHCT
ncbi:hypothetical protein RJ640_005148, partial [Escallonia rubra]